MRNVRVGYCQVARSFVSLGIIKACLFIFLNQIFVVPCYKFIQSCSGARKSIKLDCLSNYKCFYATYLVMLTFWAF